MFERLSGEPIYNTRAVAQRTSVPADTFRAWERRYAIPCPDRTSGNQRLYSERDIAIIRATQGDLPVASEPYAQAAQRLGASQEEVIAGLESLHERGGLRRVAAILYHRRAGFSANGMGVWAVPENEILETGKQMAAYRGISHCYQRPTYADWPYSVFTMAHGRSKEECDAILDSIAEATGIANRSTLYSSTEFKKIRMIYFTDDFAAWEREHGGV